ncbi:hypothetical protein NMY22_g17056 [Coprinellus aureogranulatus]|nr:hypothetical protein NMY22_g17056 [Coprinellus aureogranulatus]
MVTGASLDSFTLASENPPHRGTGLGAADPWFTPATSSIATALGPLPNLETRFSSGDAINATQPRLPYRVPSPRPPARRLSAILRSEDSERSASVYHQFAPPTPSVKSESSEHSRGCGFDDLKGVDKPYMAPTALGSTSGDSAQSSDKGKGRLAVNDEEAKQAYQRAVQARDRTQFGRSVQSAVQTTTQKSIYQEVMQARDRLIQHPGASANSTSVLSYPQVIVDSDSETVSDNSDADSSSTSSAVITIMPQPQPFPYLQTVPGPSHPTVVSQQKVFAHSPAASLEAIPIVPGSASWTPPKYIPMKRRPSQRNEGHDDGETLEVNRNAQEAQRLYARQCEECEQDFKLPNASNADQQRPNVTPAFVSVFHNPNTTAASDAPFIPPSRTSSASSMYVPVTPGPARPLQCRAPRSPSSCSSTPVTQKTVLPRPRTRSIRRTTSGTHANPTPAVSFVLPGAATTDQTGPSCSSAVQDPPVSMWNFQSPYPQGMSSGKLSTLNFNESTRPSPWGFQVAQDTSSMWGTSSLPAPSVIGRNPTGTGATPGLNNTPPDNNQAWPFTPMTNVPPAPAQWSGRNHWANTPMLQQGSAWPQSSMAWWPNGYSPNSWGIPPQAPIMPNTTLPPSTGGAAGRNTALPYTQSTALPTYSLPTPGQYNANNGTHSQFMPPLMGAPPHSDPWMARSAPPPYNGSPTNGWGTTPPVHIAIQGSGPAPGINGVPTMRYPVHPKYCFQDANITFQVQGVEYHVHRYFFENHSNQMKELVTRYTSWAGHVEPIPLMVNKDDFEKLLSIFYPSNPLESDLKVADDFSRAIRACQLLGFRDLCKSINKQAVAKLTPVERIVLSREHDVEGLNELAISAYEELCASGKPVSPEDGEKLGATTVIKIWEVQRALSAQEFCRDGCRKEFLESIVKQKFDLE